MFDKITLKSYCVHVRVLWWQELTPVHMSAHVHATVTLSVSPNANTLHRPRHIRLWD